MTTIRPFCAVRPNADAAPFIAALPYDVQSTSEARMIVTENPRIDFVGGIRGLEELEKRCDTDCAAAFALYPTSIEELFAVADAGLLMPPKSTWFEPKLRSGLFIHEI